MKSSFGHPSTVFTIHSTGTDDVIQNSCGVYCCCSFGAASSVRVCETFASSPLKTRFHSGFRPRILGNDDSSPRVYLSRKLADTSLVLLTITYNTESTELQRFLSATVRVWCCLIREVKFAFDDSEVDEIGNVAPITVSVCVSVKVLELYDYCHVYTCLLAACCSSSSSLLLQTAERPGSDVV